MLTETARRLTRELCETIQMMPTEDQILTLNESRTALHETSPFRNEPVDLVIWVPKGSVMANDYNPNSVAPPEMRLLELSIVADGYTQPIVTCPVGGHRETVDGFHRGRIGKESKKVRERVLGHLPVVSIRDSQSDEASRMAATIRHNRARGVHGVMPMTEVVATMLKVLPDDQVAKALGMDADELLRFKQVKGLPELFKDREYSRAWE